MEFLWLRKQKVSDSAGKAIEMMGFLSANTHQLNILEALDSLSPTVIME